MYLTLNVDGSLVPVDSSARAGIIVRDHQSQVVFAACWLLESGGLRRGKKVSAWRCTRRRNPSRYTLPTIRQFLTEDRCIQIQKIIISRTHRHPKFRIYLKIRFYSVQKISCTYPDPHLPTGRWVVILTERFLYTSSTSIQFKVNDSVAQRR
jgi:hypothetical protein